MSEICEEINEYYNSMKVYAKALFDTNVKEFMKSEKYQDNVEQMQKYLDVIDKKFESILIANRELKYEPVNMLIALHLSKFLSVNNEKLVEIFSKYNF